MEHMGQCIAVVSGKGGTGKTSFTAGVGAALALSGRRVLCLDCDIGLRNLDLALGLTDRALMDFSDVAQDRCSLDPAAGGASQDPRALSCSPRPCPAAGPPGDGEHRWPPCCRRSGSDLTSVCWTRRRAWAPGFRLATCGADRCVVVTTADASSLRDAQHTVMELRQLRSGQAPSGGEPGAEEAAPRSCTPPLTTPSTRRACPCWAWSRRTTPCLCA